MGTANGHGPRAMRVVIVGAGFGGIAAAIELRRKGFEDIVILEQGPGIGGTWLFNSYPGCACDVPSHLYSYSFEQRRNWSRLCSLQSEILDYLRDVARRHGVDRLVRANTTVTGCTWDERRGRWSVEVTDGESIQADAVVFATGQLHKPALPRIEGRESFAGVSFHSAEWDHDYDMRGKRVAIVGTGASAVQIVPEIAPKVGRLEVFQRTGNWFLPRRNRPYPGALRAAVSTLPIVQELRRLFIFYYTEGLTMTIRHPRTLGRLAALRSALFMRSQIRDGELRRRIWPDYTFGCKRVLFSSYFLPALQRPNVEVTTEAITEVRPEGLLTADGRLHEVDCIVWATGFRTHDFVLPMRVTGRQGRTLEQAWGASPRAYLGMTVPGFPSMFLMYGPNTNTSGGSILVYLEAQAAYIAQALCHVRASGAAAVDVKADVEDAADAAVQARFAGTAWEQCASWYRQEDGRIVANWPGYMRDYVAATRVLDAEDYELVPRPEAAPVPAEIAGGARV
ncbi:MAG TPA: NAD(P)/FAD-dependent oxidoreductase [Solirubrobacteraceae bacterium]|nr:NAD(P)/FAD-dependent oxidoreductase [Solirubrobacteraceae bacterium]